MAEQPNFRTAFNGFHREDVVQYIEELNAKHAAEVSQLNNELQYLQEKLDTLEASAAEAVEAPEAPVAVTEETPAPVPADDGLVEELEAKLAQTQEQLLEQQAENIRLQGLLDAALIRQNESRTNMELDTYRRAERVEREARSRASAVYAQANNALTNATSRVDDTASQIAELAETTMQQLKQLQLAISGSKQVLRDTATSLYSIRPEDEAE